MAAGTRQASPFAPCLSRAAGMHWQIGEGAVLCIMGGRRTTGDALGFTSARVSCAELTSRFGQRTSPGKKSCLFEERGEDDRGDSFFHSPSCFGCIPRGYIYSNSYTYAYFVKYTKIPSTFVSEGTFSGMIELMSPPRRPRCPRRAKECELTCAI